MQYIILRAIILNAPPQGPTSPHFHLVHSIEIINQNYENRSAILLHLLANFDMKTPKYYGDGFFIQI